MWGPRVKYRLEVLGGRLATWPSLHLVPPVAEAREASLRSRWLGLRTWFFA
jgi:hypothetical protein